MEKNCDKSTIGIDGNRDGVTAICPQKLKLWAKTNRINKLAGHYAHEYMHILGFNHRHWIGFSSYGWKNKTFVYKVGNIVSYLATKELTSINFNN